MTDALNPTLGRLLALCGLDRRWVRGQGVWLFDETGLIDDEAEVGAAAAVGDDGGLSSGTAYWSLGGDSGEGPMSLGGLGYYAMIGPVNTAGTMQIYVVAVDTSGNSAQSNTLNITVEYCP